MPTYDYECTACGHTFDKFQSITAPPIRRCPKCGRRKVRRLIGTGAGILFKGSGFYQTDYRSESYRKAAEKDKAPGGEKDKASGAEKDKAPGGEKDKASGSEAGGAKAEGKGDGGAKAADRASQAGGKAEKKQ